MQAIADRPGVGVIAVGPNSTTEPPPAPFEAEPTSDGLRFARGAVVGTVIALFPWSLLILLVSWLLR
jgi:hypothetical protein